MPGLMCCQRYHVVKSLAHLALPRWSHEALGCGLVGGREPSAPLGGSMLETSREGTPGDAGCLSRWSALKRGCSAWSEILAAGGFVVSWRGAARASPPPVHWWSDFNNLKGERKPSETPDTHGHAVHHVYNKFYIKPYKQNAKRNDNETKPPLASPKQKNRNNKKQDTKQCVERKMASPVRSCPQRAHTQIQTHTPKLQNWHHRGRSKNRRGSMDDHLIRLKIA